MTEQAITIDLEQFIDFSALEENVIRQLANVCESKMSGGHTESFHKMCVTAINEAVSQRISERVEQLLSKPIAPRDRFGDPLSDAEPKSLGDMLAEAVDQACLETVDRSGKPSKSTHWDKAVPRIQWHLNQLLAREIDTEAAKAIKELRADAKEKVRKQIAAAVAAQLTK